MSEKIIKFQGVQVPIQLNAAGKVIFPDVQNLRGACIQSVVLYPTNTLNVSIQSGIAAVPTQGDLAAMTLTFVSGSNEIIKDIPAISLNPSNDGGGTANVWERQEFQNLIIDWNKCYLNIYQVPSANPIYLNLGVYYFYPTKK